MASIRLTPVSAGLDARGARSAMVACSLALSLSLGCAKSTTYGGTGGHSGGGVGGATSGGGGNNGTGGGSTGVGGGGSGTGGATNTGAGGSTTGTGGNTGSTGVGGSSSNDAGGSDASCQTADFMFAPKIPTVYVLVDRSASEFDNSTSTTGTYFTLRAAVLQVIQQLQTAGTQIRFGLGIFVGNHASGTCQLELDTVPIGINNYDAIATEYNSLAQLQPPGAAADTPAFASIPMVKAALLADTAGTGQKYMMFVTDSETDFCDNGSALCPADAMTYAIQDLYSAGIGSLIIGLPTSVSNIAPSALQNFANAGAGQTVALPVVGGLTAASQIVQQCNSEPAYAPALAAIGRTAAGSMATYGSPGGNAMVFTPTSTSQAALATQISAAIAGVKSCSFDLSDVNGRSISVDTTQLGSAVVKIQGNVIPQDGTNGWNMSTATELVLNGTSCMTWESPNNNDIQFNFPCGSIIFE